MFLQPGSHGGGTSVKADHRAVLLGQLDGRWAASAREFGGCRSAQGVLRRPAVRNSNRCGAGC